MPGSPAYYIDNPSLIVELPPERYGGVAARPDPGTGISSQNLTVTTPLDQVWSRPRFKRFMAQVTFRGTLEELDPLVVLDRAVDGSRLPFTYFPDLENQAVSYRVRKDDNLVLKELEDLVLIDGEPTSYFECTVVLTGEAVMTDPDA